MNPSSRATPKAPAAAEAPRPPEPLSDRQHLQTIKHNDSSNNQGTNGLLHPCNDPAADLMQGYHGRHLNNPQSLGKVSFLTDYC